jgi:hypothetical protein
MPGDFNFWFDEGFYSIHEKLIVFHIRMGPWHYSRKTKSVFTVSKGPPLAVMTYTINTMPISPTISITTRFKLPGPPEHLSDSRIYGQGGSHTDSFTMAGLLKE